MLTSLEAAENSDMHFRQQKDPRHSLAMGVLGFLATDLPPLLVCRWLALR
jgi:hypothetical protein